MSCWLEEPVSVFEWLFAMTDLFARFKALPVIEYAKKCMHLNMQENEHDMRETIIEDLIIPD